MKTRILEPLPFSPTQWKETWQDMSHQWSTRPVHRPGRQWLLLDFEVLTDWRRTDGPTICVIVITTSRDCGRPRGSKKVIKRTLYRVARKKQELYPYAISLNNKDLIIDQCIPKLWSVKINVVKRNSLVVYCKVCREIDKILPLIARWISYSIPYGPTICDVISTPVSIIKSFRAISKRNSKNTKKSIWKLL